jgi:hypothetical protein
MGHTKDRNGRRVNGHQRLSDRDQPSLQAAALGSPMFEESWNAGSPLNWCEFVERWESRRSPDDPEDAVSTDL